MSVSEVMGWGTSLTLSSEARKPHLSSASFPLAWGFGPSSEGPWLGAGSRQLLCAVSPGRGLLGQSMRQA